MLGLAAGCHTEETNAIAFEDLPPAAKVRHVNKAIVDLPAPVEPLEN